MTDEPRWPRGTPIAPSGRGPGGGRWMGSVVTQMARAAVSSMTDHALHLRAGRAVQTARAMPDTRSIHRPGGPDTPWTPERAAMHDRILQRVYSKYKDTPTDRQALMVGGLMGAGKTSTLSVRHDPVQYMPVNPDDMKDEIIAEGGVPEHPDLAPMELNPAFHIESVHLADRLLEMALADGRNVVIDSSMGNLDAPRMRARKLAEAGYSTQGVFVDVPIETSQARSASRYLEGMRAWARGHGHGGRPIPADLIERSRGEGGRTVNRQVFEQLASEGAFDRGWEIYDNSGDAPHLVGSSKRVAHARQEPVATAGTAIWPGFEGAASAAEVAQRAQQYAKNVTGHDTRFDFGDTDPTLAAEWATGVLHGMTLFPSSKIDLVDVGQMPRPDLLDEGVEAVAKTTADGRQITFGQVSDPDKYRRELAASQRARFLAVGNPIGMALHEFAHTIANANPGMYDYVVQRAAPYAREHRQELAGLAAQEISRYTWTGGWKETLAEAFAHHAWGQHPPSGLADVMVTAMQDFLNGG